jgi:DNA helicase II / ATP-dependent DNA helicase PcrA
MKFDELYKRLNMKQKEAVDAIEGPVMVIAGPGTGKTSILTLRIANILKKTDTRPEQILALTFTESGVQAMREKLIDIIGAEAYRVNIFTFHGFANYIIKKYADEFPRIVSSDNASEVQKAEIVEKIIDTNTFEYLKPYGDIHLYVSPIINAIKHLKRESIPPGDFQKRIQKEKEDYKSISDLVYESGAHQGKIKGKYKDIEKNIKKNEELLFVYEKYEKELERRKLYDFEDMLLELIKALENNGDFLLTLQEEYQYILADEHQDANNSQNRILELLSSFHPSPNLFIVGDEKQAIFRFQGASLENFLYFKNIYKEVRLVSLENNYRSTQSILDAAHELIGKSDTEEIARPFLQSLKVNPEHPIEVIECSNEEEERRSVISQIKDLIRGGTPGHEIAILFRKNREAEGWMKELAKEGIMFSVYSERNMLEDYDVRKLLMILEAVNDPTNDAQLSEIAFFDIFKLPISAIYSALRKSREKRQTILQSFQEAPELNHFIDDILKLSSCAKNEDLITFFETFLGEHHWGASLIGSRHPLSSLASFDAFLQEVKKFTELERGSGLEDFLRYLKTVEKYKIRISAENRNDGREGVAVMTAHKSKGLEFEYVFVTGATDKTWGGRGEIKKFALPYASPSLVDDARKLFYVALTRGKKKVCVSYSNTNTEGKPNLPSQFIHEMKSELIKYSKPPETSESEEGRAFLPAKETLLDKDYLRNIFLHETFSVTALNNFLSCPWKYFFLNLIRLPTLQTKHQLYGIAVHDTLKNFSQDISREDVLKKFEDELQKKPLSKNDFEESLSKGKRSLSGYYDTYKSAWKNNILTEYNITGLTIKLPESDYEINLRGIIDKIELSKADALLPQTVHVVDYKTKKPMSRNEIEGKTKNATGDYKRQLIFYKYLLSCALDQERRYEAITGEIDFIEPDEKGKYRKEVFDLTNQDVVDMRELLENTLMKIYAMDFFDEGCDEKDCEMCKLSKIIK